MNNHYRTLGVTEQASHEEIKAAFKRLAVRFHPDKHMGDIGMEEKFKAINEAYQVLSDPYQKAQYDLQLQYQHFIASQARQSSTPPPYYNEPRKKRYGTRPNYAPPPVNKRENNQATIYAFAITFAIALLVMLAKGVYDFYLQKKYEAFLVERREIYEEAKKLYEENDIRNSLLMLADMAPFRNEEQDMKQFRTRALEDIMFKGEENYHRRDFRKAVKYYELVEQFSPYRPRAMRARLAQSYRYIDQPEKSIRMLKELISSQYEVVPTLVQIAEIYDDELNDLKSARDYLELAREVAINDYRSRFGNAYMVIVKQEYLPYDHYFLYHDLAILYNKMGESKSSLGATNWMKRVWKDSTKAWVIAAKSYELLNQPFNACREYLLAKEMGHEVDLPSYCSP